MARGWESKSVEDQQAEVVALPKATADKPLTAEQQERRRQRETLRLGRARIVQQLEAAQDPRYAEMLRRTLDDLDRQLAALHS